MWAKTEEGETGSGFGAPIYVYILAIPTQISNIPLSVASLVSIIVQSCFHAGYTHKPVIT